MTKHPDIRRCRACGCTDDDCSLCIERTGVPCSWVEDDLCSGCADSAGHTVSSRQDLHLANRADHAGDGCQAEPQFPDCCDDTLVFGMRDNHHEFTMGITTILECLHHAEQEGHVPELGYDWWSRVYTRYDSLRRLQTPVDDFLD